MSFARNLLVSVSALCLLPLAAYAQAAPATPNYVTKDEVAGLVREALVKDPTILKDAITALQKKDEEDQQAKLSESIKSNKDKLIANESLPAAGASIKDADVTLVEFFDYHCGYCKQVLEPITTLLKEDKKLRVVFVDFPILSQDSAYAARAAIALNRLDKSKYLDMHQELMHFNGKFDEKAIKKVSEKIGVDFEKLKAEMGKTEVTNLVTQNRELGQSIGITGTPAIIVGDVLLPGAVSIDEMRKVIAATREANKTKK